MPDSRQLEIVTSTALANCFGTQFFTGLKRHLPELADIRSMETLTNAVADAAELAADKPLDRSFIETATRTLVVSFARRFIEPIVTQCSVTCESPIEIAIALALGVAASAEMEAVLFEFPTETLGNDNGDTVLLIKPQAQVGQHRVDFMLTARVYQESANGTSAFQAHLIVEADGHAFHDETAAQLARDRRRDRQLQAAGFPTFRFTGSEVWNDPFAVAQEAIEFLKARLDQQRKAGQHKPPTAERNGDSLVRAAHGG